MKFPGQQYALLFGNEITDDKSMPTANFQNRGATSINQYLKAQERLGSGTEILKLSLFNRLPTVCEMLHKMGYGIRLLQLFKLLLFPD